ncbi:MFS transporter [Variovorax ginsengisoli]|uniref:MFS transporter n=1 Tax=Variovorax ginsengisoli TaxID=363844 RepID=A0ABT8SAJ0_9BURK|nr:MFS transporter [Variovorax ginsengisoli]MDN8616032.1 MFS transporter [Variovorax ginsengisoli]MDO1535202.1 MFS transporter [Variovorax ginsengisoli]
MTSLCPTALAAPAPPRRRLSPNAAFLLQASMTLGFLAGSSAPTPFYAIYQNQWGFSATMLTLAFGIYALAVLSALLVGGRLSDHVGRRPILIAAAAAQAVSMLVFATADGLPDLLLARVVQGLSAGAAIAAAGAGLLDIDKGRGAIANSVAPMMGTAAGGLLAGLMIQYLPAPMHLVYALLGSIFVLQGAAVFFMEETAPVRPGAWASLRPRLAVPLAVRGPLLLAAPALVAVWAMAGFYASLGPTLIRSFAGTTSILLGGFALFVLAGSGALAVYLIREASPTALVRLGAFALIAGMALVMTAIAQHSVLLFLLGSAVAGLGFGTGFQGALRSVVLLIAPQERAGVLSVLFVIAYLAMGLPAMVAGYDVAHQGNIVVTAYEFGSGVVLLALLALLGTARR